ncbi:MAG: EF-hand domain-containing protein [Candidimonas sp.]|jgi:hypothetical protein
MKRTVLLIPALTVTILAACASPGKPGDTALGPARPAGGHGLEAFLGSYDANRDGKVTQEEYLAIRAERFRNADTNGDGVLTEDEYVAEFTGRLKQQYFDEGREPDEHYENSIKQAHVRFGIVNRGRNGLYTSEEDRAIARKTFERLDTNKDGVVSRDDPQPKRERPAQEQEQNQNR